MNEAKDNFIRVSIQRLTDKGLFKKDCLTEDCTLSATVNKEPKSVILKKGTNILDIFDIFDNFLSADSYNIQAELGVVATQFDEEFVPQYRDLEYKHKKKRK